MSEEKKNDKEVNKSSFILEDDIQEINTKALDDVSQDEDTITKALSENGFKLFFKRNFIKVKNHLSVIPLLMVVVSLIVISFNIPTHVAAQVILSKNTLNSFYFFVNLLCGVLLVLIYLNVSSRKSSKKKVILFSVLFYLVLVFSIYLDVDYLTDMKIQMNLYNSINSIKDNDAGSVAASQSYTVAHIVCLGISAFLAILAPILQPFTKKIHLK